MEGHISALTIKRQKLKGHVERTQHRLKRVAAAREKAADMDQTLAEALASKEKALTAAHNQVHLVHTINTAAPSGPSEPLQASQAGPAGAQGGAAAAAAGGAGASQAGGQPIPVVGERC